MSVCVLLLLLFYFSCRSQRRQTVNSITAESDGMKWLSLLLPLPAGGLVGGGAECVCSVRVCEPPHRGWPGWVHSGQHSGRAVAPNRGATEFRLFRARVSMHTDSRFWLGQTLDLLDVAAQRFTPECDAMHTTKGKGARFCTFALS